MKRILNNKEIQEQGLDYADEEEDETGNLQTK